MTVHNKTLETTIRNRGAPADSFVGGLCAGMTPGDWTFKTAFLMSPGDNFSQRSLRLADALPESCREIESQLACSAFPLRGAERDVELIALHRPAPRRVLPLASRQRWRPGGLASD